MEDTAGIGGRMVQNYLHFIWLEWFKTIEILFGQWKEWGQVYSKIGYLSEN